MDSGKGKKSPGDAAQKADSESSPEASPSLARKNGRRLTLKFTGAEVPVLDEISFNPKTGDEPNLWNLTPPNKQYSWSEVPKALSLFFIKYRAWGQAGQSDVFYFQGRHKGSLAATLGDAICGSGPIHELFEESLTSGRFEDRTKLVFDGQNVHGRDRDKKDRRITVHPNYLPPDCVEIIWDNSWLTTLGELQSLESQLGQSVGIPDDTPIGEGNPPEGTPRQEVLLDGTVDTQRPKKKPDVEATVPAESFKLIKGLAREFGQLLGSLGSKPPPKSKPAQPKKQKPSPPNPTPEEKTSPTGFNESAPATAKELFGDAPQKPPGEPEPKAEKPTPQPTPGIQGGGGSGQIDGTIGGIEIEFKPLPKREKAPETPKDPEPQSLSSLPAPPPIDPKLFQIINTYGHTWDDYEPLLNFGNSDNDADVWRIRDACEGVLIFGAVGSGKTSGSGSAIARAYLQAGFGGLVLTAKPDEARRWVRMCQESGRAGDFVHVTPGSGHRLNILQYETQRPGDRMAVTDDLITLFRCILDVITRDKGGRGTNDDFWTRATNQLMRKLFDLFLLAGEPLAMDRFVRFMNLAPQDNDTDWTKIKLFADLIHRAKANANKGSEADRRIFQEVFEYWTQDLPRVTEATRSGIVTGFSAMADSLSGRGIYEMMATGTNITPEMILSGLVVILDVPLKGNVQGGLMVQAIWKLLFQQAAERRADKGLPSARPAFLWEDEGHMFFSKNDVDFQPTARDIRAPHVILSQNMHNFLQQGHDTHAMNAVFSAMNTCIFHCNGDLETNRWSSQRIGEVKKLKLTTDGLFRHLKDKDIKFLEDRRPEEMENVGTMKVIEETKAALRPEDFMKLKRGGEGTCEAVVLWLAHQFAVNQNRNFCVVTFEQEPKNL